MRNVPRDGIAQNVASAFCDDSRCYILGGGKPEIQMELIAWKFTWNEPVMELPSVETAFRYSDH